MRGRSSGAGGKRTEPYMQKTPADHAGGNMVKGSSVRRTKRNAAERYILGKIEGVWQKTDKKTDNQPGKKAGKTCRDRVPVSSYKYRKLKRNYPHWMY